MPDQKQWVTVECRENRPTFVSVVYNNRDLAIEDCVDFAIDNGRSESKKRLRERLKASGYYEDGEITISVVELGN